MALQFQETVLSELDDTGESAAIQCQNLYAVSIQVIGTGTLEGTAKLQVSNDSPIGSPGFSGGEWEPTNWNDIQDADVTLTGTPGSFLIPKTDLCYTFFKVVFTKSGGAGTVSAQVKVLGY